MTPRVIEVDPGRLDRWLAGFAERHGPIDAAAQEAPGGVVVRATADDGTVIVATPFAYEPLGLLLVRRGGYAVGLASGATLTRSKVGTRYVQSRTAAGGWSQQRFARRRDQQARELVGAVVRHAGRVLLAGDESPRGAAHGIPQGMVLGGDRALVRDVLADPALRALRGLPHREFYDLRDPRRPVLETALRRGRAYRVEIVEPTA